jgi:hypothetical protein
MALCTSIDSYIYRARNKKVIQSKIVVEDKKDIDNDCAIIPKKFMKNNWEII